MVDKLAQQDISRERVDYVPTRNPRELSFRRGQRMSQIAAIAENPSDAQLQGLASKLQADNGKSIDSDTATEMAQITMANVRTEVNQLDRLVVEVDRLKGRRWSTEGAERTGVIGELAKAKVDLAQTRANLAELADIFKQAGVRIEPQQVDPNLREKVQVGVANINTSAARTGERIQGRVAEVNTAAAKAVESASQQAARLAEVGKTSVVSVVVSANNLTRDGLKLGRDGFAKVVDAVAAVPGGVVSGGERLGTSVGGAVKAGAEGIAGGVKVGRQVIGKGLDKATSVIGSGLETVGGAVIDVSKAVYERAVAPVGSKLEAASAWIGQVRGSVSTGVAAINESAANKGQEIVAVPREMFDKARMGARARLDGFRSAMESIGKSVASANSELSQAINGFASRQGARVESIQRAITTKLTAEVGSVIQKAQEVLAPHFQSIERDRQEIRKQQETLMLKLGFIVEDIGDLAVPFIEGILDGGRDIRDGAVGLGRKQLEGLRTFGRNSAVWVRNEATPGWNFLVERWESLRVRSNESRARLNNFLDSTLETAGLRLMMIQGKVAEVNTNAASAFSGITVEGGKILRNGAMVSGDVAEWFANQGTSAAEALKDSRELVLKGVDAINRYAEVYAVAKYQEMGISKAEIERRLKLFRAVGGASLNRAAEITGRVGSMGTAMSIEAVVGATTAAAQLTKTPNGRRALCVGLGLMVGLSAHPYVAEAISNMMQNGGVPGVGPELGVGLSTFPDALAASADAGTNIISGVVDNPITNIAPDVLVNATDAGNGIVSSSVQEAALQQPGVNITSPSGVSIDAGTQQPVTQAPIVEAATPITPVTIDNFAAQIKHGEPLESELRKIVVQLGGDASQQMNVLFDRSFDLFGSEFRLSAETIANAPLGTYDEGTATRAREALAAFTRLDQNPSLRNTPEGLELIKKALWYWAPTS